MDPSPNMKAESGSENKMRQDFVCNINISAIDMNELKSPRGREEPSHEASVPAVNMLSFLLNPARKESYKTPKYSAPYKGRVTFGKPEQSIMTDKPDSSTNKKKGHHFIEYITNKSELQEESTPLKVKGSVRKIHKI